MKKLLALTLTLFLIGCQTTTTTTDTTTTTTETTTGSETTQIDELWSNYTNHDLGFSVNFINQTDVYTCIKQDDGTYESGSMTSDVQIFEDTENSTVYIAPTHAWPSKSCSEVTSDEEMINTLGSLLVAEGGISWKIIIEEVENEDYVKTFAQNKYGTGCDTMTLEESTQEGVYDVMMSAEVDLDETGFPNCFINYISFLKYAPEKGLVATWDVGQDANFYLDNETYDYPMAESFEFL